MNRTSIAALGLALALTVPTSGTALAANYGARAFESFAQAEGGDLVVPARSRHGHKFRRKFRHGHGHKFRHNFGHRHRFGRNFRRGGGHRFRHGHRHGHGHSRFSFTFVFPFHYFFPYHYPSYPSYGYGSYSYSGHHSSHQTQQRRCRPVTGTGYDRHGRRAKFGGTMCHDRYGNSYIVRGSRHVIHYYD